MKKYNIDHAVVLSLSQLYCNGWARQDAIDGILDIAKEGEHPRAYEVAGQLIKNVSEVTERLVELQEKMKKLKEVPDTGPKNVTNALFVGSTKELQKMLKQDAD